MADVSGIGERSSSGNGAVLVYYAPEAREFVSEVVLAPLEHIGLPFQLAETRLGLPGDQLLESARALIISHRGLLASLSDDESLRLIEAVQRGLGVFCLDCELGGMPDRLKKALDIESASSVVAVQGVGFDSGHAITATREDGERVLLPNSVPAQAPARLGTPWSSPMRQAVSGAPLMACRALGSGRVVQWFVSGELWTKAVYGHGMGLDDIFWKSLVWMCRKPVALKAMPPFVTLRMDDCQGSGGFWYTLQSCLYNNRPLPEPYKRMILDRISGQSSCAYHFGYLDVFHRHGYHVHLGVYPDQIRPDDMAAFQRYWQRGCMEFSIHAFADYYDVDAGGVDDFVYMRDHVSAGHGKWRVIEETPEVLEQKFARLDAWMAHWQIAASPVLNTHWANPGIASLPFLKARGWRYMMFGLSFGKPYNANIEADWRKGPYGHNGFILDYMPVPDEAKGIESDDFFAVVGHPYDYSPSDQAIDFASSDYTMKMGGQPSNDIDACANKLVKQIRRGIDARFFGCPMTHEQGLATLTKEELDTLLTIAGQRLQRYDLLHRPYAEIAAYAKAKVDTHIADAEIHGDNVRLQLDGQALVPLQIEVWTDCGDGLACVTHTIKPFAGQTTVLL